MRQAHIGLTQALPRQVREHLSLITNRDAEGTGPRPTGQETGSDSAPITIGARPSTTGHAQI